MSARLWNDLWRGAADKVANARGRDFYCERCGASDKTSMIRLLPDARQTLHRICKECVSAGVNVRRQAEAQGADKESALRAAWCSLGINYDTGEKND